MTHNASKLTLKRIVHNVEKTFVSVQTSLKTIKLVSAIPLSH